MTGFAMSETRNNMVRTALLAGGSPQSCKVWSQSQLERDCFLWRGGLHEYVISRNPTPPSLVSLLPAGENFKMLEFPKVMS